MPEYDYKPMYLHLFNKITDAAERLRAALESGDGAAKDRAALYAYAELTRAQGDAEEMYLNGGRCSSRDGNTA